MADLVPPEQEPEPGTLAEYVRRGMAARGLTSIRGLNRVSEVSQDTLRRLLAEDRVPTEGTLQRVADALGLSIQRMRRLAGRPAGESEPFVLPDRANQLNARQRDAVRELIDSFLEERPTPGSAGAVGRTPPPGE